jgi:epoxide hydrolase-like predicted phosphatase
MNIKAVIFDLGGVLVRTDNKEPRRKLAERYGMTYEEIDRLVFDSETAIRGAMGGVNIRDHWEWIAQQLKLSPEELAFFEKQFWGGDTLDHALVEFIRLLKPRYKTALLSNAWDDLRETLRNRWGILDIFDEVAISAELKMAKPDPSIYEWIVRRLGVAPGEAVFVDDMQRNIDAAEAAGLKAVRFLNTEQALAELRALLETK